jgi:hypothetical protein
MTTAPRLIPKAITDRCVMAPSLPISGGDGHVTTDQPEMSDRPRRAARRGVAQQEKEYRKTMGREFARSGEVWN